MIKWIKIENDASQLPQEEVVALREDTQELAIGYLNVDEKGMLICDEEYSILELPTHYILKADILKLEA